MATPAISKPPSRSGRVRAGHSGVVRRRDSAKNAAPGGLGAPVASIGGTGTFDGIFLTGILAVLLA